MLFKLCELGFAPHPDFLGEVLSFEQVQDWQMYESQYGFRNDLLMGLQCAVTANCHVGKDHEGYKPTDFMPYIEEREPDPVELDQKLERMLAPFAIQQG